MITDRELRSEFVAALEAVTPPAPWLAASIEKTWRETQRTRRRRRIAPGLRIRLHWTSGLVAVLLVVALLAALLYASAVLTRRHSVPASPSSHALGGGSGMVSPTVGWWDTNGEGNIVRTTDGGISWTDATPASFVQDITASTFFLDATHAWDIETISANGSSQTITFRTSDGGNTWRSGTDITIAGQVFSPPRTYFFDTSHGWLLFGISTLESTNQELFKTVDGGLTWTLVADKLLGDGTSNLTGCHWDTLAFASTSVGWSLATCPGATYQQLLVTHDGGKTWAPEQLARGIGAGTNLGCPCQTPLVFDHGQAMILATASSPPPSRLELLMTSDAGTTWSPRALPGEAIFGMDFTDPQHGWAIAGPASIFSRDSSGQFPALPGVAVPLYRTVDGGLTWTPVLTSLPFASGDGRIQDLYFVDQQHGFADRFNVTTQIGQLLATADGGRTWHVVGRTPSG